MLLQKHKKKRGTRAGKTHTMSPRTGPQEASGRDVNVLRAMLRAFLDLSSVIQGR